MNSEYLKLACEMAGLKVVSAENVLWCVYVPACKDDGSTAMKRYSRHCPLLPAYVAEMLKEQVYSKYGLWGLGMLERALLQADGATPIGANTNERIRAAICVLNLEEAA